MHHFKLGKKPGNSGGNGILMACGDGFGAGAWCLRCLGGRRGEKQQKTSSGEEIVL